MHHPAGPPPPRPLRCRRVPGAPPAGRGRGSARARPPAPLPAPPEGASSTAAAHPTPRPGTAPRRATRTLRPGTRPPPPRHRPPEGARSTAAAHLPRPSPPARALATRNAFRVPPASAAFRPGPSEAAGARRGCGSSARLRGTGGATSGGGSPASGCTHVNANPGDRAGHPAVSRHCAGCGGGPGGRMESQTGADRGVQSGVNTQNLYR